MSPASSGSLEVERYIGACLISSHHQNRGAGSKKDYYDPGCNRYANHGSRCGVNVEGWAGGMPLISFATYQRRGGNHRPQDHTRQDSAPTIRYHHHVQQPQACNPLSRLAGAPLIFANRYNQRRGRYHQPGGGGRNFKPQHHHHNQDGLKTNNNNGTTCAADSLSVNSDESSASTNSETGGVLPRIIKPRKRRKKDRKPALSVLTVGQQDESFSTDSGSPDIDVSVSPGVFHLPLVAAQRYNLSKELSESPSLHHFFEDVQESPDDRDLNRTSCQCRYCDPSGQIWDVERHCYSPFPTTLHPRRSFSISDVQDDIFGRSYESSLSPEIIEGISNLSFSSEAERTPPPSPRSSPGDLEVSTEIVTSLNNGHRDLEIKFFSTPISVVNKCCTTTGDDVITASANNVNSECVLVSKE